MYRKLLLTLFFVISFSFFTACTPRADSPTTTAADLPNPASVNCEQKGGELEMRTDANGGVAGICIFQDGSECDEWAFFRGECKPGDSLAATQPATLPEMGSPTAQPETGLLRAAYFSAGYVKLWTEGYGSIPLAEANTELVRISDDGQVIAFLGSDLQGNDGIFGVDPDGSNLRLLAGQDYLQTIQPAPQVISLDFAPSSHMLYFVTEQYDLHRVDAAGGKTPVSLFRANTGGFFSFSPDGQWMTLYHPNELVLTHPDGSGARTAFQFPADFLYTMLGPHVIWEPDSAAFRIYSATEPQATVWRVPVTSDPLKLISYIAPYSANLSPDGNQVVYLNYQNDPIDVHVMDINGQDMTYGSFSSVEYLNLDFLGWRPDSKSFLLNLSDDGRLQDPWLCTPGREPVKLTDTGYAYAVNWVDADRFLFISEIDLRLQSVGQPSKVLDTIQASGYDFTFFTP